tara:strand:- start:193 stop:636 length:444 start_codon:yes stop_codon:yes gene_type:complete
MGQMKQFKKLYEEDMYCGDEELDQILDELTEFRVIGKAQRRKIARRMARLVKTAGFKTKVKRSMLRIASVAKQKVKAAKLAKQQVIDKYFPTYKSMSLPQRVKTDQKIQQRYGGLINKLTVKKMRVVKKKEIEKVKKARERIGQKDA